MKTGTQIIYVPNHAEGDVNHPDAERGFVTREDGDCHFCRFWHRGNLHVLRTKSGSERVLTANLVEQVSVPQERVEDSLDEILAGR